ncbi:hypothetical protein [Sulfurisphaera tokodaii]|uniref:YfhO family protein n=2 Tax=Sulfurisphaera tokodaii TaxID=111955 RepID=Q96Z69_SULTO|nr:hypothetical protein [Sulfurisphaera tokodaii]BAB67057.1 hypothetical protein STK_19620 [Sulfurisphaera tokodaii str. 7]HII74425.1 hypothetical protein [Sulfurisphaera tokodaii]
MLSLRKIKVSFLLLYIIPFIIDSILLYTYLNGGIIYWLDSNFPFNPALWIRKILFYYWNDPFFPGAPLAYSQDSLFTGLIIFLLVNVLHLSLEMAEFFYLLIFIYLSQVGFISLLRIILGLLGKRYNRNLIFIGGLVGGFIYSWGFYSYTPPILGVNYPFFILYSLFPIALYLSLKYIFDEKFVSITLIALYLILLSGTQFSAFTYLLWVIIIYTTIITFIWMSIRKPSFIQFIIKNVIIIFITVIAGLEQLYQIYNASLGAFYVGVHDKFLGKPIVISETNAQYNSFPLTSFISLYTPEKYEIVGALLFALVLSSLLFTRDKSSRFFSLLLSLLLIIGGASSGVINVLPLYSLHSTPIGFVIIGLMYGIQHIFSGFPISFIGSLSISYLIPQLFEYFKRKRNYIKALLLLIILLIPSLYVYSNFETASLHTGIRAFNLPVNATNIFYPPQQLIDVGNYLSAHDGFYNVIEFPMQYAGGMYDDNGTKAVWYTIYPLSDYIMGQIIKSPASNVVYPIYLYFPSFNLNNVTNYFVLLGAKYIVLNKQEYPAPGVPLGHAGGYPWNYTKFIEVLSHTPNISLVIENSYYNVYVINLNVSLLYPSEGIVKNVSYYHLFFLYADNTLKAQKQSIIYGLGAVNITNISGVHIKILIDYCNEMYTVEVNAPRPFYLVFDEGYSPQWTLYINGKINARHYMANGYANAWLMPAGNYTAVIQLRIIPTIHEYFIISSLGLIIILLVFIFQRFRVFDKIVKRG